MASAIKQPIDAAAFVQSLDAPSLRAQLVALQEQEKAVRVLLRAAVVRERAAARRAELARREAARA
jgi:hypothetical protein